jgi:RNA polymerase sigma factor (sigma-70 family)
MEVWPISDEALLTAVGAGDRDAATTFVRRFQSRVYGLALSILGDAAAAEDVAQETFVRAWRYAASYDARRGRVSTWLLSIARNAALDRTRVKGQPPLAPEAVAALLERGPDAVGVDETARVDERERMRGLLADLPADQRRAVVLAIYFGRTAREISELDGVPLGTVKTRIRTGMSRLRRTLEVADGPA